MLPYITFLKYSLLQCPLLFTSEFCAASVAFFTVHCNYSHFFSFYCFACAHARMHPIQTWVNQIIFNLIEILLIKIKHIVFILTSACLVDKDMSAFPERYFWSWDLSVQSHMMLHNWIWDLGLSMGHPDYELYLLPLWYQCLWRVALSLSKLRPWITLSVGEI